MEIGSPDASRNQEPGVVRKGNQLRCEFPVGLPSDMPGQPRHAPEFRRRLLRWFRRHGRDLPWRRTRDPYHVIVSEFMLQQTQVSRVEAYYHRFLERYPSIESLAAAPTGDGAGELGRAGVLPARGQPSPAGPGGGARPRRGHSRPIPVELRRLPGVGRYTAGAVASFAYERSAPAVDTNVARVIRRAFHPRAPAKALGNRLWARRSRSCRAGARAPGRSIRESWSSGR